MTGSRRFSPRWLAAGGIAVLAAVLGTALLLQNGGSACAAPPSTSVKKGIASYFFLEGTLGSCSYPSPPADDLYVALGPSQFAAADSCGTYIEVTGPKGKVRVKVIDSCPKCPVGQLDLSLTAFKKIGKQSEGIIPITYKTVVSPSVPGPLSVRIKEGSSQYWLSLLVDNHANELSSVKVAGSSGTFRAASREDFNYWTLPSGLGKGPFKVKVTDTYGHTATVSNIKLSIGKTQLTSVSLTGAPIVKVPTKKTTGAAPAKTKKAAPKPAKTSASPKPSASSSAPVAPAPPEATAAETTATAPAVVDLAAGTPTSCG